MPLSRWRTVVHVLKNPDRAGLYRDLVRDPELWCAPPELPGHPLDPVARDEECIDEVAVFAAARWHALSGEDLSEARLDQLRQLLRGYPSEQARRARDMDG